MKIDDANNPSDFSQSKSHKQCIPRENPERRPYVWPTGWSITIARKTGGFRTKHPKSNQRRSIMTRNFSCNNVRQTAFVWTLESDSSHRAVHKSTQSSMVVRPETCGAVTYWRWRGLITSSAEPSVVVIQCVLGGYSTRWTPSVTIKRKCVKGSAHFNVKIW